MSLSAKTFKSQGDPAQYDLRGMGEDKGYKTTKSEREIDRDTLMV